MSVKSIPGGYEVDCRPNGRYGKRYRKRFKTRGEALQYERWLLSTHHNKPWLERPTDKRPLTMLIDRWYELHGQQLKSGQKERQHLLNLASDLGDPIASKVTKSAFSQYRANKMQQGKKAATINRNHNRLSSVFTVLITAGEYYGEHPLKGLSKLSEPSREMGFLSLSEVKALIDKLDGDPLLIARVCLETGARWSEAATLTKSQVVNGKITFLNTKNGKNRTVPIHVELSNALVKQPGRKLFAANCYGAFYAVLKEMAFDLPKGQAAHVLRHTFASHFIMNGGNILTLQKVLGHANILQTMTYAHLAPDYLSEAIALNPLSTFRPNCQN